MYVRHVVVENIKSFGAAGGTRGDAPMELDLQRPNGTYAGWTVLAGRNGSGKSTFLQAVALALAGPEAARTLNEGWANWIRHGASSGRVSVEVLPDAVDRSAYGGASSPGGFWASLEWRTSGTGPEPVMTAEPYLAAAGGARLWDVATGAKLRTLTGHQGGIRAVAFSPDGRSLASAGNDGSVRLWDAATGVALRTLIGHGDEVNSVAFSADGSVLASASDDGSVRLWDTGNGVALRILIGHRAWVLAVAFAPDGRMLASAGDDGKVRLWERATGLELRVLEGHRDWARAVAFSPDGTTLASAGFDGTVRLWEPVSGSELGVLTGHQSHVNAVAFSPDGHTLASAGDDGDVRLWDPAVGSEVAILTGHRGRVRAVAFSPDGLVLASAGNDGNVRLWDLATGHELRTFTGHEGWVGTLAFSSDGSTLVSAGEDAGDDAEQSAERGPWAENPMGWLVVGYGPFRRVSSASGEAVRLMVAPGHVARLVSLFREDASLAESVKWLESIYVRRLEGRERWARLEAEVIRLLNDGLLPEGFVVERIDSDGLWVRQGDVTLPMQELSDGYRTVAALVLDIVRHVFLTFGDLELREGPDCVIIPHPGVVLIDEIDAHLHVSWQQRIGFWLKDRFPRVQFIVSTHSPFVCQAADERGLIRLPAPGDAGPPRHVSDELFLSVTRGSADEATLSELFGLEHTHSQLSERLRQRVAELEAQLLHGPPGIGESPELEALRAELPDSAAASVDQAWRLLTRELDEGLD